MSIFDQNCITQSLKRFIQNKTNSPLWRQHNTHFMVNNEFTTVINVLTYPRKQTKIIINKRNSTLYIIKEIMHSFHIFVQHSWEGATNQQISYSWESTTNEQVSYSWEGATNQQVS